MMPLIERERNGYFLRSGTNLSRGNWWPAMLQLHEIEERATKFDTRETVGGVRTHMH